VGMRQNQLVVNRHLTQNHRGAMKSDELANQWYTCLQRTRCMTVEIFDAYYHSLVYLLLKLLGFTIHAEPLTSLGRTDAVLDLPEAVYIIEFKVQSSQENAQTALQQIRDKQYDAPYRSAGKPIILLGIAFDPVGRTISDWAEEAL
jgi:hypothetical protein